MQTATHRPTIDTLCHLHPSLWRAHQLGRSRTACVPTGFTELNAQLPGGGWPHHQCTEILFQQPGIGELQFLLPALRQLAQNGQRIAFVNPPFIPMPNVLEHWGLPVTQWLWVQAHTPKNQLWATAQLQQSQAVGALLSWLPEAHHLLAGSHLRRLQQHASQMPGLCFLFRPTKAATQASPAPLRLELSAPTLHQINIRILKRKGPTAIDPIVIPTRPMLHTQPSLCPKKPTRFPLFVQSQEKPDAMDSHHIQH